MLINGVEYTYANLRISLLGNTDVAGCSSLTYSEAQQKGTTKGTGSKPHGVYIGGSEYAGEITLSAKEIKRIREAVGGSLTSALPFTITVEYANGVDAPTVDIIHYAAFKEDHGGGSAGTDGELTYTIPLLVGGVTFAGTTPL